MLSVKNQIDILKTLLYILSFFPVFLVAQSTIELDSTTIDVNILTDDLDIPWEIAWGPDNQIWMTERSGQISTVNPETGEKTDLLFLSDCVEIQETGLLGLVLHPDFLETPHVFVVYTHYNLLADISEKIVRFEYDSENNALINDTIIFQGIPGFDNHVGSRLVITPDLKMFVTTGDANEPEKAQDPNLLNGKTLRLNIDGSIPKDNPFGPENPVWSVGHRNAQGMVLAPNGKLYVAEHGPASDDELNEILEAHNYGWENVEGYCDTDSEIAFCDTVSVTEPIYGWTPTIAPCGLDYYQHPAIPEWQNSLIMAVLKSRDVRVMQLNETGDSIIDGAENPILNAEYGRFRDLCFSPDGSIYLATSNNDFYGDPITYGPDKILKLESKQFNQLPPPYPQANFIMSVDSCGLLSVKNLSINADSYEWNILDVNNQVIASLTEENPSYQFPMNGWYTIQLNVQLNAINGDFTNTKNYRVQIQETCLQANFVAQDSCLMVQFLNQSVSATTYSWDFDNGTFSEEAAPTVIYENAGTYAVSLIVSNAENQDTVEQMIEIEACIMDGLQQVNGVGEKQIKLFPNPVKSELWVYIPDEFKNAILQIYNSQGQLVFQTKSEAFEESISLKMNDLNNGIYWLSLKSKENQTIFSKFVVE